jgi:hypothetical protein
MHNPNPNPISLPMHGIAGADKSIISNKDIVAIMTCSCI